MKKFNIWISQKLQTCHSVSSYPDVTQVFPQAGPSSRSISSSSDVQSDLVICKTLSAFAVRTPSSVPTPLRPKVVGCLLAGLAPLLSSLTPLLQPVPASGQTRLFTRAAPSRNMISWLSSSRVLEPPDYYSLFMRLNNLVQCKYWRRQIWCINPTSNQAEAAWSPHAHEEFTWPGWKHSLHFSCIWKLLVKDEV